MLFVPDDQSAEKKLKVLLFVLTALFLVDLIMSFQIAQFLLTTERRWDISSTAFFLEKILTAIALWGCWTTKKFGWILLVGLLVFSILLTMISFGRHFFSDHSAILDLNSMRETFGLPSNFGTFLSLIFDVAIVLFLNTPPIRKVFEINKNIQLNTFSITAVVTLLTLLIPYIN